MSAPSPRRDVLEGADPEILKRHFLSTYLGLRLGLLVTAVALPLLLWWGGAAAFGLPLQQSMSAYYHTGMRNWFVGALFAVGALLVSYKGYSRKEDWAFNLAALFIVGVALVSTAEPSAVPVAAGDFVTLHGVFAILFFACVGYVCIFRADDTLSLLHTVPEPKNPRPVRNPVPWYRSQRRLRSLYRTIGVVMLLSPVTAALIDALMRSRSGDRTFIFWLEATAVWAFAAFWLVKSWEVHQTGVERLTAEGVVALRPKVTGRVGRLVQVAPSDLTGLSEREREDVAQWLAGSEAPPTATR